MSTARGHMTAVELSSSRGSFQRLMRSSSPPSDGHGALAVTGRFAGSGVAGSDRRKTGSADARRSRVVRLRYRLAAIRVVEP